MKHTIIKRLFRKSNKNDMTLGCYILLCIALTTETTTVPTIGDSVKSTSDKHDVSPVPVLMKTPALDAKLRPKQPLDTHHVLLKELFKTARNLLTGNKLKQELSGNSLVSDLNVINLPDLLLDINPSTYEKSIIKDIDKGMTVVPVLSDILCKACKLEGDLECIKRHCLTSASGPKDTDPGMPSDILCKACTLKGDLECKKRHCMTSASGPKGNGAERPIVPILGDMLCLACKEMKDPTCIKRHCLADKSAEKINPSIILPSRPEALDRTIA